MLVLMRGATDAKFFAGWIETQEMNKNIVIYEY